MSETRHRERVGGHAWERPQPARSYLWASECERTFKADLSHSRADAWAAAST